ncbi:MAG: hypothetical protein HYU66_22950 [Armatimonadetes bacterium]|nr:hypothetical protein [Armatimonadota bacterium]
MASVAAGLAGSTKYNGILVLPCVWLAAGLVWRREAWKLVLASTSVAVLTVVVTSPFLLIDPQAAVDAHFEIFVHPHFTDLYGDVGPGWLFHLRWNLPTATGTLFALIAAAGLALLPYRRRRAAWLVLLWVGLVALSLLRTKELYLRYLTPLLPPLCIAAAAALERARAKGLLAHLACLLCLCAPGWRAAAFAAMMARPDARDLAAAWCSQNIPAGASVGDIGADGIQWFYSVPLSPNNGGARAKKLGSPSRYRLRLDLAAWPRDPPEWLVLNLNRAAEQFRGPDGERQWADLTARYEQVAGFENEARVAPWWRISGRGSRLHDWQYTLPVIAIYRRR